LLYPKVLMEAYKLLFLNIRKRIEKNEVITHLIGNSGNEKTCRCMEKGSPSEI
jgi:hypothetical protein